MAAIFADFGHGVLSSAFTISDFNHKGKEINHKGLLRADNDHHIIGIKRAWYATQNLASVFGGGVWETEGCDDSPCLLIERDSFAWDGRF